MRCCSDLSAANNKARTHKDTLLGTRTHTHTERLQAIIHIARSTIQLVSGYMLKNECLSLSQPLHLSSSCQCYYFQTNTHKCSTLSDRTRYKYTPRAVRQTHTRKHTNTSGVGEEEGESAALHNTVNSVMRCVLEGRGEGKHEQQLKIQ